MSIFLPDISFLPRPALVWCERGIQVLLTTMGAFAAFALMTVAIGTDYWLYARAFICNSTANSSQDESNNKDKKDPGALTHSGLWRICCLEGTTAANANVRVQACLFNGGHACYYAFSNRGQKSQEGIFQVLTWISFLLKYFFRDKRSKKL